MGLVSDLISVSYINSHTESITAYSLLFFLYNMADIIFARFTDGSSGRLPDGDIMKYGVGGFFGWQNPLNFALPASPSCASMYECEQEL